MLIIIRPNYKGISQRAAEIVKKRILKKPNLVLGLATGSTPLGMYQELIKMHKTQGLNFSEVTTFNLDEYLGLGPLHSQSYFYYMQENFFKFINIKQKNIFIPNGLTQSPEKHCLWYEQKIQEKGKIDLQILGIGRNGHLGFNEPGSSFESRTRVINLDKTTIADNARFFKNISQVPKQAITMGLKTIARTRECLLLANGSHKAEIIYKALKSPITENVPGSILQKHRKVVVLLDKEAGKDLN